MNVLLRVLEIAVIPVVVAVITALGAWISNKASDARIESLRTENTDQHAEGRALLGHLSNQITGIDSKVDRLDERLDNVQQWASNHENAHLIEDSAQS